MQCSISRDSQTNNSSYFHSWFKKYFFSSKVYRWILHLHNPKVFAQSQYWSQIKFKRPWQKKKKRSSESRIKATLDVVILELFLSWILFINANVFFFILENLFLWSCILYVHHISPIPFFSCPPPLCFALLPLTSTVV